MGTHISWSPCIPHLCLNYITNFAVCQDLFLIFFLLAVRLERTSSLCRLNRRHQPQIGEPDSNGWSGTSGDSPQPKHTICVLYPYYIITGAICQVLYFAEKILDENLVVFRGSFPSPFGGWGGTRTHIFLLLSSRPTIERPNHLDLAPSISTSKVCGVSFPYLICIAGLALSDLIGLTRLSWVSLLA